MLGISIGLEEDSQLARRQLDQAYRRFRLSFRASLAAAALLTISLWDVADHGTLLMWLAAMALLMSIRNHYALRYGRLRQGVQANLERWKAGFVLGAAAAGFAWSATVYLFVASPFDQAGGLLFFVIAGVTAFAGASMSCLPASAVAFLLAALLPLAFWLFMFGTGLGYFMGAGILVYLAFMLQLSGQFYGVIRNQFSTTVQNRALSTAVRESEARYHQIFNHSLEGIFLLDVTDEQFFRVVEVNAAFERMVGIPRALLMGRLSGAALPGAMAAKVEGMLRRCLESGAAQEETVELDIAVDVRTFCFTLTPVYAPGGRVVRIVGMIRDITAQKKAEDGLRGNEAFLNSLLDSIPIPVFYKDRKGRYIGFNRAYETFLGATKDKLIGKTVFDISSRELAEIYREMDVKLFESGGVQQYESQVVNAQGEVRDIIFSKATFADARGSVAGLVGAILDISDRKHSESLREAARKQMEEQNAQLQIYREELELRVMERTRELSASNQQLRAEIGERKLAEEMLLESRIRLRGLIARREEVREEERKHIAREIHDELGQILSGLQLNIGLAISKYGSDSTLLHRHLQEMSGLAASAIGSVRNLASSLRPVEVERGFVHALRLLVERFGAYTGIQCKVHVADGDIDLDENDAISLYRIVQESLTNIAKHAHADAVHVSLGREAEGYVLKVCDNGKGFDVNETRSNSFGLLGMQERSSMLGGTVVVNSSAGKGTEVEVQIPFVFISGEA